MSLKTLKRVCRIILILAVIDCAAILLSLWLFTEVMLPYLYPMCMALCALALASIVLRILFNRCPSCGGYLGRWIGFDYCKHCGEKLED